jgi:hypothetical protein
MANATLIDVLGPFRHEDRVAALCAGVDGPRDEFARIFGTQFHVDSSVSNMLGSPTTHRAKRIRSDRGLKQGG